MAAKEDVRVKFCQRCMRLTRATHQWFDRLAPGVPHHLCLFGLGLGGHPVHVPLDKALKLGFASLCLFALLPLPQRTCAALRILGLRRLHGECPGIECRDNQTLLTQSCPHNTVTTARRRPFFFQSVQRGRNLPSASHSPRDFSRRPCCTSIATGRGLWIFVCVVFQQPTLFAEAVR